MFAREESAFPFFLLGPTRSLAKPTAAPSSNHELNSHDGGVGIIPRNKAIQAFGRGDVRAKRVPYATVKGKDVVRGRRSLWPGVNALAGVF